jgi:2-polyprenyl-3-methyl-5-hydroxy-6-metoxy-1,4-benzoquinol methylase
MTAVHSTRGNGLLENFLSRKRACVANSLIQESLRDGAILDIGCGSFPFFLSTTHFARKYAIDRVEAEAWPDILQSEIVFVNQDVETSDFLPFDDGFFDVITMLAVIEHVNPVKIPVILKEVRRVLKWGGIVIVTTPMPWTELLLKALSTINLVSSREIDEHKAMYNTEKLSSLFSQASFSCEKMRFGHFEFCMNTWGVAEK